jgi:cobalt-zinc-cadmium efflux system outer membrane protein
MIIRSDSKAYLKLNCGILLFTISFVTAIHTNGQIDTSFKKQNLSYAEYLSLIGQNNLAFAAEKFNINIRQARLQLARIFPDPIITMGVFDNGQRNLQTGYGFLLAVSRLVELGGKRKARINLANSEIDFTQALLEDYFRNLRADATLNFIEGLKQQQLIHVKYSSYENMRQLGVAEQKRFELGYIKEIDAVQAKVEAGILLKEAFQAESDLKNALLQLAIYVGKQRSDTLYFPLGDLGNADRTFELSTLITTALNNRADLLAALKYKTVAQNNLKLVKANRMLDLNLQLSNYNNSKISNIIEPTPSYNTLNFGVAIPLKFSNRYTGDLKIAEYQIQKADIQYKIIELQIQIVVTQAYTQYLSTKKQIDQFEQGLLEQSKRVLDGKIYSYKRGETSLLEVLNAQRTYNGVQLTYIDVLSNYASSLVELERASGIWDINF